jgi:hypothetical protein
MKKLTMLMMVAALAATACSNDAEPKGDASDTPAACPSRTAAISPTAFPATFPALPDVTYTGTTTAGPTTIITGFSAKDLDQSYEAIKNAFTTPYDVEKSEKEADEAEVEYEGGGIRGQVKLEEKCVGQTEVRITVRPAD